MLRLANYKPPHKSQGPISELASRLTGSEFVIERWPQWPDAGYGEAVSVFENHTSWFSEIKTRIARKNWHPDLLRVITADMPSALRLASWIRKHQLGSKTDEWRRGEYVRSIDPHFQQGEQVAAAGADYRIATVRPMILGHNAGAVEWSTPGGKPRRLELSIQGVEVMAVKLEPLAGGDPITVMAELPGRDFWRGEVKSLRDQLKKAAHNAGLHAEASAEIDQLQRMVMRLRPAAVITPELIAGRSFQAAALHPDLSDQIGDGIVMTSLAVQSAERELLVVRRQERSGW